MNLSRDRQTRYFIFQVSTSLPARLVHAERTARSHYGLLKSHSAFRKRSTFLNRNPTRSSLSSTPSRKSFRNISKLRVSQRLPRRARARILRQDRITGHHNHNLRRTSWIYPSVLRSLEERLELRTLTIHSDIVSQVSTMTPRTSTRAISESISSTSTRPNSGPSSLREPRLPSSFSKYVR